MRIWLDEDAYGTAGYLRTTKPETTTDGEPNFYPEVDMPAYLVYAFGDALEELATVQHVIAELCQDIAGAIGRHGMNPLIEAQREAWHAERRAAHRKGSAY